jgi:hypothetical protein
MESALTNRPSVGSRYAARVVIIQPNPRLLALPGELEIGGRRAALPANAAVGEVARAVAGRASGQTRCTSQLIYRKKKGRQLYCHPNKWRASYQGGGFCS